MVNARPRLLFSFFIQTEEERDECIDFLRMLYMGPLNETGQAQFQVFWYGPWMSEDWRQINLALLTACAEYRPETVIIINGWQPDYWPMGEWYAQLQTYYMIRKLYGCKVTALLTDQAYHSFKLSDNLVRVCDFVFTHEAEETFIGYTAFPQKHFVTPTAYSSRYFEGDPHSNRDIELLFIGGVAGYQNQRAAGIEALKENGVEVSVLGGRGREGKLSNDEYAGSVKRAKIVLNWSRHISGRWYQAKGRIFETTLAGSMLLCEDCAAVNRWFEPYVDYVPFTGNEDLVEKARYYLVNETERLQIALKGHEKALQLYRAEVIWGNRLKDLEEKSYYDEIEALTALGDNASGKQVELARFLQRELRGAGISNTKVINELVSFIEKAHQSLINRGRRWGREWSWRINKKALGLLRRTIWRCRQIPGFIFSNWGSRSRSDKS
jgi:hypothetical protein